MLFRRLGSLCRANRIRTRLLPQSREDAALMDHNRAQRARREAEGRGVSVTVSRSGIVEPIEWGKHASKYTGSR